MTLRRTIATALRRGANEAEGVARARVRKWDAERSTTAERLNRLELIGALAHACRHAAAMLDPQPDATVINVHVNGRRVEPAAPACAGVVGVEQAAGAAVADAQRGWSSHDVHGTTVSVCADSQGYPAMSVERGGRMRVVKGGRA